MTSYNIIVHASNKEFAEFFDHDHMISVRTYERSPYTLQDGRSIFKCTIRHTELDRPIPEGKVFESIQSLRKYIWKYKTNQMC